MNLLLSPVRNFKLTKPLFALSSVEKTLCLAILAYITALFIRLFNCPYLTFDERYFAPCVSLVKEYGWTRRMFLLIPFHPGPLVLWTHALFAPLTHTGLLPMRALNFILFVIAMGSMMTSVWMVHKNRAAVWGAFGILGFPTMTLISGLVLSDMPAFACFCLGLAFLIAGLQNRTAWSWPALIVSGLCFGLSILGRQTYLTSVLTLPLLGLSYPKRRVFAALALSLLPFSYELWIWRGWVPPLVAYMVGDLHASHFILALFYIAFFLMVLSPGYLKIRMPQFLIAAFCFALINFSGHWMSFFPMRTLMLSLLGTRWMPLYSSIVAGAALAVSFFVLKRLLEECEFHKRDGMRFFFMANILISLLTPMAISHGFQAKYIVGSLPFLILIVSPKISWALIGRISCGALLGLVLLQTNMAAATKTAVTCNDVIRGVIAEHRACLEKKPAPKTPPLPIFH